MQALHWQLSESEGVLQRWGKLGLRKVLGLVGLGAQLCHLF